MKTRSLALASMLLLLSLGSLCNARPHTRRLVSIVRNGVITTKNHDAFISFRARRGQRLNASATSRTPGFYPLLFITSPSGRNLTQDKNTSYSARLTETGVYRVRVGTNLMASENSGNSAYHLELHLR